MGGAVDTFVAAASADSFGEITLALRRRDSGLFDGLYHAKIQGPSDAEPISEFTVYLDNSAAAQERTTVYPRGFREDLALLEPGEYKVDWIQDSDDEIVGTVRFWIDES